MIIHSMGYIIKYEGLMVGINKENWLSQNVPPYNGICSKYWPLHNLSACMQIRIIGLSYTTILVIYCVTKKLLILRYLLTNSCS